MSFYNRNSQERARNVRRLRRLCATGAGVIILAALARSTQAAPITLSDLNSSATIDPSLQSGMSNWTVNGTNQLFQQWFWYRTGSTGQEFSIETLPLVSSIVSDTNFNTGFDNLALRYGTA